MIRHAFAYRVAEIPLSRKRMALKISRVRFCVPGVRGMRRAPSTLRGDLARRRDCVPSATRCRQKNAAGLKERPLKRGEFFARDSGAVARMRGLPGIDASLPGQPRMTRQLDREIGAARD